MELKPSFSPSLRASLPVSLPGGQSQAGAQEVGGVTSEPGKDTSVPMKI